MDFRVVEIDVRKRERRNCKLASAFGKTRFVPLTSGEHEAQFRRFQAEGETGKAADIAVQKYVRVHLKKKERKGKTDKGE